MTVSVLLVCTAMLVAGPRLTEAVYALNHPQVQFCSADFVLQASVLNFDAKAHSYTVKVLDVFKDDIDLSKADGTKFVGGRIQLVLYSRYNFPLQDGKAYILAGRFSNAKLEMTMGDWLFPFQPTDNEWNNLSPTQKEGLFFHYKRGCGCQIGRCYGQPDCLKKALGCEYSSLENRPRLDLCRMKHQYCQMKVEGGSTKCQWKNRTTDEFKDCEKTP